mgnify:CR=1 FL=1
MCADSTDSLASMYRAPPPREDVQNFKTLLEEMPDKKRRKTHIWIAFIMVVAATIVLVLYGDEISSLLDFDDDAEIKV